MFVLKSTYKSLEERYNSFLQVEGISMTPISHKIWEYKIPEVVYKRTKDELGVSDKEMRVIIVDFFDYMITVKKYKNVEMLSKSTDVLWHNLILDTQSYLDFCINYIGFYVHHTSHLSEKVLSKDEVSEIEQKYKTAISEQGTSYSNYRNNNTSDNTLMWLLFLSTMSIDGNSSSSCSSSSCSSSSCSSSSCSSSSYSSSC